MTSKRLSGRRVLLTRPVGEGLKEWQTALEAEGAEVIAYPVTEIVAPESWDPVDEAIARIQTFGGIVFTSQTAVRMLLDRCPGRRIPLGLFVAAVGPKTAEAVVASGRACDIVANDSRQEGLVEALSRQSSALPLLFPRAEKVRPLLGRTLRAQGWNLHEVVVYRTEVSTVSPVEFAFDVAVFASPSSIRAFLLKNPRDSVSVYMSLTIGLTTSTYASAMGLRPVMTEKPDVHSVIACLAARV